MTSQVSQVATIKPLEGELIKRMTPKEAEDNPELFRVRSFWLVDLFPDELIINEKTITMIRRQFLMTSRETISIKDIGRIIYIDTPFFDQLRILGKNTAHELIIHGLFPAQAKRAKDILDALVLVEQMETEMPYWLHVDPRGELPYIEAREKHMPFHFTLRG